MNRKCFHLSLLGAGLLLASIAYFACHPDPTTFEPFPWDMSHHYRSAIELANTARSFDLEAIGKKLLKADLYPPGRSVILGCWLLVCGESNQSWQLYHWATLAAGVLALWTCCFVQDFRDRRVFFLTSTVLLSATPMLLALSNTFMIEAPSGVSLLFAVAGLASLQFVDGRSRGWLAVLAGLFLAATLLTKYNVGLPLLPAAVVLAVYFRVHGKRPAAVAALSAAGIGLLIWAGFLTLQSNGWDFFFRFAENRSNSAGLSPLVRFWRYCEIFAGNYVAYPAIAILIGGLSVVALVRRLNPLTLVAGVYVLGTIAALARHSYILQRNLYPAVVLLVLLAGVGTAAVVRDFLQLELPPVWRKTVGWAGYLVGLAVAVILLGSATEDGRRLTDRMYNGHKEGIKQLSAFLADELARPGPCRVVGTFNELSAGWVRILAARGGNQVDPLHLEFPYPLEKSRTSRDPRPDPVYAATVEKWAGETKERVITIEVTETSPWWTENARNWTAWKRNFTDAIAACDKFEQIRYLDLPKAGLRARVFIPAPHSLSFHSGWSTSKTWGRWALAERAELLVQNAREYPWLRIQYASFERMKQPQLCLVLVNDAPVDSFTVAGKPWQWEERWVPIRMSNKDGPAQISIEFARRYEAAGRLRALPFADITVKRERPTMPSHPNQ